MTSGHLTFRLFSGTQGADLADALIVREAVFIQEQGIDPELEIDDYDYIAWHVVGAIASQPVATARFVNLDANTGKIGRVAVLPAYRRQGIATKLVDLLTEYGKREGISRLVLDSQLAAMELYRRLGFVPVGDAFLDAGILHMRMIKDVRHS